MHQTPTWLAGLFALLGLVLGYPAESMAQGGADKITEATQAFGALDFESALHMLDEALTVPGNGPTELVHLYTLRALCWISLGKAKRAERSFRAALSIQPALRLTADVSPRYSEPFMRILDSGVPALEVEIQPPAAVTRGEQVVVSVRLVADPVNISDHVVFRYRRAGDPQYESVRVKLTRGKKDRFALPSAVWDRSGLAALEWHAAILDRHGGTLQAQGDASRPMQVKVRAKVIPPAVASAGTDAKAKAAVKPQARTAWYQRWWVWALIGGAAVAAGTTVGILAFGEPSAPRRDFTLVIE